MNIPDTGRDRRLMVTVGGQRYALPVMDVESVLSVRRGDVSSVPFDQSGRIRGIFMDHGSVVPLVRREGMAAASDTAGSDTLTVVILRHKAWRLALAVDKAEAVTAASAEISVPLLTAAMLYTGEACHGSD